MVMRYYGLGVGHMAAPVGPVNASTTRQASNLNQQDEELYDDVDVMTARQFDINVEDDITNVGAEDEDMDAEAEAEDMDAEVEGEDVLDDGNESNDDDEDLEDDDTLYFHS